MQEESAKPCRPSNTNHNRYDAIHYNAASDDYPLKFVSLYTPDSEDDRAETLPPPSSLAASSSIGVFSKSRSVKDIIVDFCDRTSSHGIPHIASSPSLTGKVIWTLVFVTCSIVFAYQTYLTVTDYMRWRTVIEIELKVEAAAFPAVTVCNLNSYKKSELFNIPEVMDIYHQYVQEMKRVAAMQKNRSSRAKRQVRYHPIHVNCRCIDPQQECVPLYNLDEPDQTTCLCFEDEQSGDIWPCYQASVWTSGRRCSNCSLTNSCQMPADNKTIDSEGTVPCICQSISNKCVKLPPGGIPWWRPLNYRSYNLTTTTTTTTSTEPATTTRENPGSVFTDQNAGTAIERLKTYISGLLAIMDEEARFNLSYTADELIEWCSFNAEPCDLERHLKIHFDTVFGNCYTFNSNRSHPMKNTRAGPTHGLRMLLNVHQSSYLPFTEAAGVRIVIHDQDHFPFPDSLGYSAPTGMMSSFGLKCQKVKRIRACQHADLQGFYLFDESYSAEGCVTSCFQQLAINECGCGDPKYPVFPSQRPCDPRSNETVWDNFFGGDKLALSKESVCLVRFTKDFSSIIHEHSNESGKQRRCYCDQPCTDTLYQSSYSAAIWPAENHEIHGTVCPEGMEGKNCTDYIRTNTALLEIFFEQLTYEDLSEVEAYGIIKLLADFGGNIGLWIGFSVITFVEFLELITEIAIFGYRRARSRSNRKRKTRYARPVAFQYVNRLAEESFQNDPSSSVDDSERFNVAHSSKKSSVR